ncbi:MAG: hypothetical protein M1160_00625 [Candidatus Marsarchaeota archaeon]|jgi:hypothetical protein|nr:hypothetical protein [Candidatus Marsarchaeota archaeon]MCL5111371.1 hypothetical protein [Candidatus Marsarchaeota archaeon]
MADEPNFLDLVSLSKITPDLVVEKFGGRINSSFFDGSNILGTLRLKGLIDFTANFPGQSVITITDQGKQLLKEANEKAALPFDSVDLAILQQLQAGKRSYLDIGNAVNLRPKDLAMHLYKMGIQQFAAYDIKNGVLDVMLTEKGMIQAKAGVPQPGQQKPAEAQQPATQQQAQQPTGQPQQPQPQAQQPTGQPQQPQPQAQQAPTAEQIAGSMSMEDIEKQIKSSKRARNMKIAIVVIVLIVAIFVVLYLKGSIHV